MLLVVVGVGVGVARYDSSRYVPCIVYGTIGSHKAEPLAEHARHRMKVGSRNYKDFSKSRSRRIHAETISTAVSVSSITLFEREEIW